MTPSLEHILSDSLLAVAAGSDTTASVLTTTFYFLMRNPEYYKRLQAEVDKFYPPGENSLDPQHHQNMVVLEAVMYAHHIDLLEYLVSQYYRRNETLRMYPVLLSGSQRAPQVGHGDRVIGP